MEVRKVLKRFGVNAQREVEKAVRAAIDDGILSGGETLGVRISLSVERAGAEFELEDTITLS